MATTSVATTNTTNAFSCVQVRLRQFGEFFCRLMLEDHLFYAHHDAHKVKF